MKGLYDYILKHFVANDELLPSMNTPRSQGYYTYASDSHIVIRIETDKLQNDYSWNDKAPDYENFWIGNNPKTGNIIEEKINIESILELVNKFHIELINKKHLCEECEGNGEVTCETCNHEHECEDCHGSGQIEEKIQTEFMKLVYNKDEDGTLIQYVDVLNTRYSPRYIELILFCMLSTNSKSLTMRIENKKDLTYFQFDNIEILLMQMKKGGE